MSRLQNVKSHQYAYWKVPAPELLELEAVFLNCHVTGISILSITCTRNNTVFLKPPRCIKILIVICYRGAFPGSYGSPCAKICIGTDRLNAAVISGMTSLLVMFASARSVGWGSNEAVIPVSCTLSKCSYVQYRNN
jgi:hypothetical protein